jgi:CheY-like chemotaxis protein
MAGVDLIGLSLQELKHQAICRISQSAEASLTLNSNFEFISSCLQTIRNTHAFMLMAINRTVDYTKASKGLKLVPRNETIDLKECIQMPLNCMENMQGRIQIRLNSIPGEICSHVITDRQWLQENMLCLLSNAVKYSTEGIVDVTVSLEEQWAVPWAERSFVLSSHVDDDLSTVSERTDRQLSLLHVIKSEENLKQVMSFIRIEVEDTGIGLTEQVMVQLFNPFKQSQRFSGGTGLGLYSLAKRVEALHGSSGVMKRRDGKQGSLFWLTIPYKPDVMSAQHKQEEVAQQQQQQQLQQQQKQQQQQQQQQQYDVDTCPQSQVSLLGVTPTDPVKLEVTEKPTLSTTSSLNILVVDDSPAIVKMVCLILKRLGHRTDIAENGAIAVKMVEEAPDVSFDVVLMDLQMPVMDGLEATTRIRQWDNSHGMRRAIIAMSANSDHETSLSALKAGANVFLPKPFNVDSFRSTLGAILTTNDEQP